MAAATKKAAQTGTFSANTGQPTTDLRSPRKSLLGVPFLNWTTVFIRINAPGAMLFSKGGRATITYKNGHFQP